MSTHKPIPKGLTRDHVLRAMAELDSGLNHDFGVATSWVVRHEGKEYAPKALIGLGFRHFTGTILSHRDFSSGENPSQAVGYLRRLGFEVVRLAEGTDWSRREVDLLIADYFLMLQAELLGKPFSKTQHRTQLKALLPGRSDGSIEFKHANVSAVLVKMGIPYIEGYKPRGNFQGLLVTAVEEYLQHHAGFFTLAETAPTLNPTVMPMVELKPAALFEDPPEAIIVPEPLDQPWLTRKGKRIDFARRDAENRAMGRLGEQFVLDVEKRRLLDLRRDDLAKKVEWIADTCGDGVGYDILSFNEQDDSERFVEVKTTGAAKEFPFYVTAGEVRCSEATKEKYHLYRVFDFAKHPRIYQLRGSLSEVCQLQPMVYRASI